MAILGLQFKNKGWLPVLAVVIGIGLIFFLGVRLKKSGFESIRELPAAIFPTEKGEEKEELPEVKLEFSQAPILEEEMGYTERAETGEGLTHLARRALKKYLQALPGVYQLTPEHKIYIEDYLATKMGGRWLRLGEEVEFSEDLLKEGIEKAGQLTLTQLENLKQYSQLVPGLIY